MSVPSLGPEGRQIYEGYEVLSPQKKNVGNGQTLKREADSVDGADRSASGGFDDGSDIGVEDGAPVAKKAVGDLAMDGTGAQGPLGPVVGGGDVSVRHEDEEMTAALPDDRVQLRASPGGRDEAHQAIEAGCKRGWVNENALDLIATDLVTAGRRVGSSA